MSSVSLIIISTKGKRDLKQKKYYKIFFSLLLFLRWVSTVISWIFLRGQKVRQKKDVKIIEKHAIFTVKNFLVFFAQKRFFPSLLWKFIELKVLYFCSFLCFFFCFWYYALRQKKLLHKKFIENRREKSERRKKGTKSLCNTKDIFDIFTCSAIDFFTCESMFSSEFILRLYCIIYKSFWFGEKGTKFKSPFSDLEI